MARDSKAVLLLCAMIGACGVASAEEDFSLHVPNSALHFRYSPAGDHATLTVSVPTKYLDVEFHYAQIQIGDDPENEAFLRFDAGMTRRHGMASTRITLPRKHPLVKFRAIYVRENRMAELIAEFRPSGRVR